MRVVWALSIAREVVLKSKLIVICSVWHFTQTNRG